MKVLVSADIEGVAGIFHFEQTKSGNNEYELARQLMTNEVRACAEGLINAGANEVIINDSHGSFRNILPSEFKNFGNKVKLILGKPRYLGMMAGLEEKPDAIVLIGYHAKSETLGVLAHTINSFAFSKIFINNLELSEAGIYGALAGEFRVPIIMACGDNVFIEETKLIFPDSLWVQTKVAYGNNSGLSLTPDESCKKIKKNVKLAFRKFSDAKDKFRFLTLENPVECKIITRSSALADLFCMLPILVRLDAITIKFFTDNMQNAVRIINSLSAMSFMLR